VEAVLYSAPHIHRRKKLRFKLTENNIEIFLNLEPPGDPRGVESRIQKVNLKTCERKRRSRVLSRAA